MLLLFGVCSSIRCCKSVSNFSFSHCAEFLIQINSLTVISLKIFGFFVRRVEGNSKNCEFYLAFSVDSVLYCLKFVPRPCTFVQNNFKNILSHVLIERIFFDFRHLVVYFVYLLAFQSHCLFYNGYNWESYCLFSNFIIEKKEKIPEYIYLTSKHDTGVRKYSKATELQPVRLVK